MSRVTKQLKKLSLSNLLGDGRGSDKDDGHLKKLQHSSGRKKLPTVPTQEEQSNMKESIRLRSPVNTDHLAAYGQFFLEYSMLAEFNHLRKQKIPGVYVIPSHENPLVWHGVIFVRMGIYQNGIFHFTLKVPNNYPDGDCPSLIFMPPVFHPVIHPETGQVDIKRAFKSWRPNVNHLWQVLLYARRIFYKIETNEPLNKAAADLFDSDNEAFKERVGRNVENCQENLFTSPDETKETHEITFCEWNLELHEAAREQILGDRNRNLSEPEHLNETSANLRNGIETKPKLSGLSFMEPGSTVIFSKEEN